MAQTFRELVGIELHPDGTGTVKIEEHHLNDNRVLDGGVSMTLLDKVMTEALERASGGRAFTTEVAFDQGLFVLPHAVRVGNVLRATATVVDAAGQPVSVSGEVYLHGTVRLVANGHWIVKGVKQPAHTV